MNDDVASKLSDLEDAFLSCEDIEDCWKLDLCYLDEGLLLADEPTSKVNLNYLFFFFFLVSLGLGLIL